MYQVSLIIPTYNERENITLLLKEIFEVIKTFREIDLEVIIVDDNSPDGTGQIADTMTNLYPVKVIHRKSKMGLGSAVMEGFALSDRDYLGVIDGDLSHDPIIIAELINALKEYDISIGSRFQKSSSVEDWRLDRKIISKIGVWLAKLVADISDPLSGYFFLRRDVLNGVTLTSAGYKILLEILVKWQYLKTKEIPFVFRSREHSSSKLNAKEYLLFIKQILIFLYQKYTPKTSQK